ncbi:MAG: TonB-dependent receptor [Myxococcales bacterium]|nr:TonB-dependent receptor [Myxococcales bacterium]
MRTTLPLLVALALAFPARADNTADEADVAFSLGNAAYSKRDYERALASYFLSYRLVPNRNVLFNIARCYEALDRFDEAYRYWNDLFVDPTLPADERKDVKQALARLAPRVALVTVTSTPPGADLYVDRKDLGSRGRTPQTFAVSPGAHTILLELEGHRPAQVKVSVGKGREVKQVVELSIIVGKATIEGAPEGASIRESAEGPELGKVPATLELVPGKRLLVVSAKGHLSQQLLLDVKADQTVTAKAVLQEKPKATGKVVVTANRDGALVRVDGKDSGFTPTVLTLPVGEYEVEVTTEEVTPLVRRVVVAEDSELRVDAELRYAPPKVVAASKQALSVDQAPASVTVITREELLGQGYQTLAEALRGVRGFFFTDDRIYTYAGLRGFSPPGDLNTRLLTLWDGHPLNDVWAGQGFVARDFDVDLSDVERIEVVRGPTSILFGTGAFFGVINVVPRRRIERSRNVEAVGGVGDLNGGKVRATGALGREGSSLKASAAGMLAEGAPTTPLSDGTLVQGMDGERSLGASLLGEWKGFTLLGKLNQRRKQVPTAPYGAAPGVAGTEYTDARGFAELRYEHAFSRVTLNGRASYDGSRYRGYYAKLDSNGEQYRDSDTGGADWFGGEVRAGITLFEGNRLTASFEGNVQLVRQQGTGLPEEHYTRVLLSGTLLDEWQIISRVFVQLGLRLDKYFDLPGVALSPRGAVVAKLYEGGVTKLVVGQAFRAPTIYELNFSDNNETQRRPDQPQQPEIITTFEAEHSHDLTPELRLTVGGYYNLIDRLIVLEEDDVMPERCGSPTEPVQCVVYTNAADRFTAGGAEAELRWQPGRWTIVDATYSFVMLGGVDANAVSYPQHLATLKALVPVKEGFVRLSGQLTYQSARRAGDGTHVGEAFLINLGLQGEYGPLRYFAGVRNLLDQKYTLPVATEAGFGTVQQYGRTLYIELAAGF